MNIYYLREFRKAAFHSFKIQKTLSCYMIIDKRIKGSNIYISKADTLEDAKAKLKAFREDYIKERIIELQNEKRFKWL